MGTCRGWKKNCGREKEAAALVAEGGGTKSIPQDSLEMNFGKDQRTGMVKMVKK